MDVSVLELKCAARSDAGRRSNNEDAAFASSRLAVVADGVGGAAAGEIASWAVVNSFITLDKSRLRRSLEADLQMAISHGNDTIRFIAECRPETAGMGTTLTAVVLASDGSYLLANVGDSRTYLLRDGSLTQLTRDDSFVQALIDDGTITPAQAREHPQRSVVLAALDGHPGAEPELERVAAKAGDRLLLCSDGLSDAIDDDAIAEALRIPSRQMSAETLIGMALRAGGRDNISVIVVDVVTPASPTSGWLAIEDPPHATDQR
jgi:PPM family protein phosphatase